MKAKASFLDQSFKAGYFVAWQGQIYQVAQPEEIEPTPLVIWLRDVTTGGGADKSYVELRGVAQNIRSGLGRRIAGNRGS